MFINAAGTANDVSDEMAEFLRYLREGVGNSRFVERLDCAVRKARDHMEWRTEYMSLQLKFYDIWDEARDEGLEEGRAKGLEEGRAKGLEEGRAKGLEEGRMSQLFELVRDQDITLDSALRKSGMTKEEFQQKMTEHFSQKVVI